MVVQAFDHAPRFADRVARMLERVEFRAALAPADREAAYRLRYQAYLRQNLLGPRVDAMLHDEIYDKSDNALTTLTFIDGELASTVRVHVVTNDAAASPTCDVFPDVLAPHLRMRRIIVDPSRLAAQAEMSSEFPELALLALRPAWMAAQHFNADILVLSCAAGHQAFYRRMCGHQTWSGLRNYPKVTAKVVCMGLHFPTGRERVESRYPSFRSTPGEREALFGGLSQSITPVKSVVNRSLARDPLPSAECRVLVKAAAGRKHPVSNSPYCLNFAMPSRAS